jgi:hypothetical protein
MNLDQVNKWLTLVANLGVVAGIVLVAVQLHLNTEAIRLQNAYDLNVGLRSADIALIGDTGAAAYGIALVKPADLTEAQLMQLWSYLDIPGSSALNTWIAYQAGSVSGDDWTSAKSQFISYMNFDAGRIWWKYAKVDLPPQFAKEIDQALSSSDEHHVERLVQNMMTDLRQLGR